MHESYWQLNDSPFRHSNDARFFFSSPTHDEALARLHFLVDEQRQLGILTADEGSGKTLLFKVLKEQLRQRGRIVSKLNMLGLDERGFWWSLAAELELNPDISEDSFVLWRRISDKIQENAYQDVTTVILLDDVDGADATLITSMLRLLKSHPENLVMVLATAPANLMRLADLLPLCELRIQLESFTAEDTRDYLSKSLELAGRNAPIFEDSATRRIHELSGGIPRHICQLAQMALLAGAGEQLESIDATIIDSVFLELGVADPQPTEIVFDEGGARVEAIL